MAHPAESVLDWAAAAVGPGARVVGWEALQDNPGVRGPWRLRIDHGRSTIELVLKTAPVEKTAARSTTTYVDPRSLIATEAVALTLAENHGVAAPRLLAADLDGDCGMFAIVSTAIPGSGGVPFKSLRALAAAAAPLGSVSLSPSPELPVRTRPRQGDDYIGLRHLAARYRDSTATEQALVADEVSADQPHRSPEQIHAILRKQQSTPLIDAAESRLSGLPVPGGDAVLVHGDLCAGNAVHTPSGSVVIVDWEGAGVAHWGLDLGNLRFEAALHFGVQAAHEVMRGWQTAVAIDPATLRYWDLTAALNTPADLSRWAPKLGGGTERRDAFLRAALDGDLY